MQDPNEWLRKGERAYYRQSSHRQRIIELQLDSKCLRDVSRSIRLTDGDRCTLCVISRGLEETILGYLAGNIALLPSAANLRELPVLVSFLNSLLQGFLSCALVSDYLLDKDQVKY